MRWILRTIFAVALLSVISAMIAPKWMARTKTELLGDKDQSETSDPSQGDGQTNDDGDSDRANRTSETNRSDDADPNVYRSPLVGGLAQLAGQLSDATGQEQPSVGGMLAEADAILDRAGRQNRFAMQEVNRPMRRVGPRDPHLILITVQGLSHELVEEHADDSSMVYQTLLDRGIRFTQYRTHHDPAVAWRSLHLASEQQSDRRVSSSMVRYVKRSGYNTALVGECSFSPPFRGLDDANYDQRFGNESERQRESAELASVWSNGRELEIFVDPDDPAVCAHELYADEAALFVLENRQGRPFFVHLSLDYESLAERLGSATIEQLGSDSVDLTPRQIAAANLSHAIQQMLGAVKLADISHRSVVVVAGLGAPADQPDVERPEAGPSVPLMVYWPSRDRDDPPVVIPCGVSDVMASLIDWANAHRFVNLPQLKGRSLRPGNLSRLSYSGRTMTWRSPGHSTVVCQDPWLLVDDVLPSLTNLRSDRRTEMNLADEYPEIVSRLHDAIGGQPQ